MTTPVVLGRHYLAPLFGRFLRRHPGLKLSWLLVDRYVNLVEEGFDLSVRVGSLTDSSLRSRRLGEMRVRVVASPTYLEDQDGPKHPKGLRDHVCISKSSTRSPRRWAFQGPEGVFHVTIQPALEANDGQTVCDLARSGTGIARLPDFLADEHLASGELVALLEDFEIKPQPIALVYPHDRFITPALSAFIEYLVAHFPDRGNPDRKR